MLRQRESSLGQQIGIVRFACVVVIVVLAVGLWANFPYLVVEHRRLELWKIAGLLIGDLVGLLWFARFAFAHAVLGEPLIELSVEDARKRLSTLVIVGLMAILADGSFSVYLMHAEQVGYAKANITEAEIIAICEHKRSEATGYDLDCRFSDETGARHEAHLRVLAAGHVFPPGLPLETARVLSGVEKNQKQIRIRYDPRFPARAWVDGLGWNDENGIYWVSIGSLAIQAAVTGVFLLLLSRFSAGRVWPWWWDVYKVLPLAAESFCMLAMGLIDRLMDSLA